MKLQIHTHELKRLVSVANNSIDKKELVPILAYVRLIAENNVLKSVSTNLSIGHVLECPAKVDVAGDVLVPAATLAKAVSKLPGEQTQLELKDNAIIVSSEKTRYKLPITADEEKSFPDLESSFAASSVRIPANPFRTMLLRSSLACIVGIEDKPSLSGVYIEYDGEVLKMTGTDANSLAHMEIEVEGDAFSSFILPQDSAREIARLIKTYEPEYVEIGIGSSYFCVRFTNVSFLSRTVEGSFPNYPALLQNIVTENTLSFDASHLLNVLERASLFRTSDMSVLSFVPQDSHLYAHTNPKDTGTYNEELQLEKDAVLPDFIISFNPTTMMKTIRELPKETERISIELCNANNKPIILRSKAESFKDDIYLLMPITI